MASDDEMNTAFLWAGLQTSKNTFTVIILIVPQNIDVTDYQSHFTEPKMEAQTG